MPALHDVQRRWISLEEHPSLRYQVPWSGYWFAEWRSLVHGYLIQPYTPKGEDVLTFLRVANKWDFDSQKNASLEVLKTNGSAAERIAAARQYDEVKEWLVPAFEELSQTFVPPSEKDGRLLGSMGLLRLWYIHSYKRRNSHAQHVNRYIQYLVLENGVLGTFPGDICSITFS